MNCFKSPKPIGARRAVARGGDFLICVGLRFAELRFQAINSLKKVIIISILIPVAGCSFHSAQWESAKALWAMRTPTQPGHETYWWGMEHEGQTYRMFPVAWDGKTVLTDAKRWMIVLQNSEITMIQDLQKNRQIAVKDSVDPVVGAGEMGGNADTSRRHLGSHYPGVWTEVFVVEGPLGKPLEGTRTEKFCLSSRFDTRSLRSITRCIIDEQETDFRMAEFDLSGNIIGLRLNLRSNRIWTIYRTDDLVDAFEVRRYLDGDVDEI